MKEDARLGYTLWSREESATRDNAKSVTGASLIKSQSTTGLLLPFK